MTGSDFEGSGREGGREGGREDESVLLNGLSIFVTEPKTIKHTTANTGRTRPYIPRLF